MEFRSIAFFLLLLAPASRSQEMDGGCSYSYVEQPPPALPCRPGAELLLLECSVHAPPTSSSSSAATLTVAWWYHSSPSGVDCSSSNGGARRLGSTQGEVVRELSLQTETGQAVRSQLRLLLTGGGGVAAGSYWCQLESAEEGGRRFTRSQVLTVLPPETYIHLPVCSSSTAVSVTEEVVCAETATEDDCITVPDAMATVANEAPVTIATTLLPTTSTPTHSEDSAVITTKMTVVVSTDSKEEATILELFMADTTAETERGSEKLTVQLLAAIAVVVVLAVLVGVLTLVCVCICFRARHETKRLKHQRRMQRDSLRTLSTIRCSTVASDYLVPQPFHLQSSRTLPPNYTFPPSLRQSFALNSLRISHDYEDIPDLLEEEGGGNGFFAADKRSNHPGALTMKRNAAYRAYIIDSSSSSSQWLREGPSLSTSASLYTNLSCQTPEPL